MLSQIAPEALSEMQHYPPPAKLPFDFGSEVARNEYFAKIRKGLVPTSNGRYVRTGGLAASMFFTGTSTKGQFVFKAGTRSAIAKKVVGSMDANRDERIPGHINTGWPLLRNTVNFWLEAADEEMQKEVESIYVAYRSTKKNR